MKIFALILAAGNSKRMNFNKAFLKDTNGKYFLEKIVGEYKKSCTNIIVVVNNELIKMYNKNKCNFLLNTMVVLNDKTEFGRFYSIITGINKLPDINYCFIHNVDNPFINTTLINKILSKKEINSYTVPVYKNKGGHPILIGKKIIKSLQNEKNINKRLDVFLSKHNKIAIPVNNSEILLNINTIEDYDKYIREIAN